MTSHRWDTDEAVLADLAEALAAARPMADRVRQLGVGAFAWQGVDTDLELASLVYDSSLDAELAVRGADIRSHRTVVFDSGEASVQLSHSGDLVVGQLIPPGDGDLTVVTAGGATTRAVVDELGCFSLIGLPTEPVRLRWQTTTASFVTDWIRW